MILIELFIDNDVFVVNCMEKNSNIKFDFMYFYSNLELIDGVSFFRLYRIFNCFCCCK